MTYALDNLLVIAPSPLDDDRLEAWLAQLALASKLGPLEDFAPAFSKRALSLNVSVIRPAVTSVQGSTWPELVASAGGMVDPIERGVSANMVSGAAVWLEATAEHALAASFAAQAFGGEQAISVVVFDLTPGAVLRFLQPLGRQALKRICAGFEGAGVAPYFMARERSSGEALLALGVPTLLDAAALGRCVPGGGDISEQELDLSVVRASARTPGPVDPLCQRILELCDLRTHGPVRVTVKGTAEEIARAGAYLEDLVRSRVSLRLELAEVPSDAIGLEALRASPLLAAAFGSKIEAGRDSDPDALDYREMRASMLPEQLTLELARRFVDQIGHGLKDIGFAGETIQLDVRP